jgi:hypothetical protein
MSQDQAPAGPVSPPPQGTQNPPAPGQVERRRPGRPAEVSPELLPLLRYQPTPEGLDVAEPWPTWASVAEPRNGRDPLRAVRGIAVGVVLTAPIWVGLLGLVWLGLHILSVAGSR